MKFRNSLKMVPGALSVLCLLAAGQGAQAQVEPGQVNEMLGIMQRHLSEVKLRAVPGARLGDTSTTALKLGQRFYRVGEKWAVRFEPTSDPSIATMARKSILDADSQNPITADPIIYDYAVLAVSGEGNAKIGITQRLTRPEAKANGLVDHVVLTIGPRFTPVGKEIHYRDGRPPLSIAIAARGNFAMGFDATPTDLPNILTDNGTPVRGLDGAAGLEFTTVDIYGRPVTTLWREGEVWPASVKTTSGTATLLR